MSATKNNRALRLLAWHGGAFLAGCALMFLARFLEGSWTGGLLPPVLVEEGLKALLFAAPLAVRRWPPPRGIPAPDLLPLLAITGFASAENVLFFLASPTSSIYLRLLYAYPVHVNTALLYSLAFLSARPALFAAAVLAGGAYHLALNALASSGREAAVWAVGAANLAAMLLLAVRLRRVRLERSFETCWNSE
jgi:hypothetical protein